MPTRGPTRCATAAPERARRRFPVDRRRGVARASPRSTRASSRTCRVRAQLHRLDVDADPIEAIGEVGDLRRARRIDRRARGPISDSSAWTPWPRSPNRSARSTWTARRRRVRPLRRDRAPHAALPRPPEVQVVHVEQPRLGLARKHPDERSLHVVVETERRTAPSPAPRAASGRFSSPRKVPSTPSLQHEAERRAASTSSRSTSRDRHRSRRS